MKKIKSVFKKKKKKKKKIFTISPKTQEKSEVLKQILEKKYSDSNLVNLSILRNSTNKNGGSYKQLVSRRRKRSDFRTIKVIGRGSFGEIRLVQEKQSGEFYALKILKKSEMLRRKQVHHVRAERDILAESVGTEWIVDLKYAFQDMNFLYLVMVFRGNFSLIEDEVRFYMAEILLAVEHVHSSNFVHRDLKPDNMYVILPFINNFRLIKENGHIKLTDFGLSKPFDGGDSKQREKNEKEREKLKRGAISLKKELKSSNELKKSWKEKGRKLLFSTVGSNGYISPEILLKNGYGIETDYWSLGVIMFEMLCGYPPFFTEDGNPIKTCHKIIRWKEFLEFPDDVDLSLEAEDLIRSMICNREDRLTKDEIMSHPFFNGINWNKVSEMEAPLKPTLNSPYDTSYFDNFPDSNEFGGDPIEEEKHRNILKKDKDLLFYQFTYNKDFDLKSNSKIQRKDKSRASILETDFFL